MIEYDKLASILRHGTNEEIEFIIKNDYEKVIEYILISNELPWGLTNRTDILEELFKRGKYDFIYKFNMTQLAEEFVEKYKKEIVDLIIEKNKVPFCLDKNKTIFSEIIKLKKYNLIFQFDISLQTREALESYIEGIVNYIINTKKVELLKTESNLIRNRFLRYYGMDDIKILRNELIAEQLIRRSEIDLVCKFETSTVKEALKKVPHTSQLFEQFIIRKEYDLAFEIDESVITEEIIKNNIGTIIEYIEKHYSIPKNIKNDKLLLTEIIKRGNLDIIFIYGLFDPSAITDEMIINNIEKFIEYIEKYKYIPKKLSNNKLLLNEVIKRGNLDLGHIFIAFDQSAITDEIIKSNIDKIMEWIKKNYIPKELGYSKVLLDEVIKRGNLNLETIFSIFDQSAITDEIIKSNIDKIMEWIEKYSIPTKLGYSKVLLDEIIKRGNLNIEHILDSFAPAIISYEIIRNNIDKIIEDLNKRRYNSPNYIRDERLNKLIFQELLNKKIEIDFLVDLGFFNKELLNNEETKKSIYSLLQISEEELKQKIEKLISVNDETLETINLKIIGKRFENINIRRIIDFIPYSDVQLLIVNLNQKESKIFTRIVNYLDKFDFDTCPIIYNFLKNKNNYNELLNTINYDQLDDELINNLIRIMQNNHNYLNIKDVEQLKNKNYEEIKNKYFTQIEEKISSNQITIDELKESIFLKKYDMSIEEVEFIINRYCHNMEIIKNSAIPEKIKKILEILEYIYNCNNIEELKFYHIGKTNQKEVYDILNLETIIRKQYALLFNEKLYKLKENEKYNVPNSNQQFYLLRDDFNLLIHVVGAYRHYEHNESYKDDWNIPKIKNHGICTSYIGNNQIANARNLDENPIYGFSEIEPQCLLRESCRDIGSRNETYAASLEGKGNIYHTFYTPESLIDHTRHTHNEIVIDRKITKESHQIKRQPNYIVYIIDDINNKDNFNENNEYYKATLKAAHDFNLPIVIIDRLYFAKKETEKCIKLEQEIISNKQYNKISELITIFINNMIGCNYYGGTKYEYHNFFTIDLFKELYGRLKSEVNNQDLNNNEKLSLLLNILKALKIEQEKQKLDSTDFDFNFRINEKIEEIKELINSIEHIEEKEQAPNENNKNEELIKVINYYYNSSEAIKKQIEEDIQNGLTKEEIIKKINSNQYREHKRRQ